MITRIGMAPRLPEMTVSRFQEHWRTSHADAAGQIPGTRRYVQNHAVLVGGRMVLPYPGFDACSELDFDSVESMEQGFASETYQTVVRADEKAFVEKSRFSLVIARRTTLIDGPDLEGVKLLSLYRAHPAAGASALVDTLVGERAPTVAAAAPMRHDVLVPIPGAHRDGRLPAAADAVEIVWFADVDAAMDFLASEADLVLAGRVFGAARLIAKPLEVVG